MTTIKYTTEGRVQIDCKDGNSKPIAVTWLEGGVVARLHSASLSIELSKSQLEQLDGLASRIAMDLEPKEVLK